MENMQELEELLMGEEARLTKREENVFLWIEFLTNEEEELTDEEKKAWEVRK